MIVSPRFSIVTICRNDREGLMLTAESVRAQTFGDYEWIVVDGASSDGTLEYLDSLSFGDWESAPDAGIYDAMNKGLLRTSGAYLLFLNAGDSFADSRVLERLDAEIGSGTPDFVYGDALEETGEPRAPLWQKKAKSAEKIRSGMITHHQAMLYRRGSLGGLRYDPGLSIAGDYDFTLRFLLKTRKRLYWPFPICVFRAGGISQRQAASGRREERAIRRKILKTGIFEEAKTALRQTAAQTLKRLFPPLFRWVRSL